MTTFEQEFGGDTFKSRPLEAPPAAGCCFMGDHLGPWSDYGTGIDIIGTVHCVARCERCQALATPPIWIRTPDGAQRSDKLCESGPLHYNHHTAESEAQYKERLKQRLRSCGWRILEEEVTGKHPDSPRALRIDMVAEPPNLAKWADQDCGRNVRFGIECKRHNQKLSAAIWQSVDYSLTTFDEYGRLPILITPRPWSLHGDTCRIFGRGRIGDLHFESHKWHWSGNRPERIPETLRVSMSGSVLWDEHEGVTTPGRTRKLMDPRFGSAR